jgi:hypothetical protein
MQFEYTEPQTPMEEFFGGHFCINAYGSIQAGDGEKFKRFLENGSVPPRTHVYINSGGGDVDAALDIGRIVRSRWLSTSIGQYVLDPKPHVTLTVPRKLMPGVCMSAATLIFLGGRLRFFPTDAKFGVHQFSFTNPSPTDLVRSQQLSAKIARYVSEMNITAEFIELSAAVEPSKIELVALRRLEDLGIVTGGETKPEWTTHARNGMLYVRGERDCLFGHHKVMLGFVKSQGFVFWAVIEAQGRERELTTFDLVEVVVNDEQFRIDISSRCARIAEGIYVQIFSSITEDEARILAHSDSFGVQIRGSSEAEIFFGISAISTEGGEDMLKTLFEHGVS